LMFCAALILTAAGAIPASAQTFRGTILGTVTDTSGAAILHATVTARNRDPGVGRSTDTNGDGSYLIPELPIGTYKVTISQSGFQTSVTNGVNADAAAGRGADAVLKPGQVSQQVIVEGETLPQVDTTSDTLGGTIENRQIENLPINGRDYTKLLIMVPGAVGEPNGGGTPPAPLGPFAGQALA